MIALPLAAPGTGNRLCDGPRADLVQCAGAGDVDAEDQGVVADDIASR
jgi:hypothetical protein